MKKIIFPIIFMFVISAAFAEINVERVLPSSVQPGQTVRITENIFVKDIDRLDFSEMLPSNWSMDSWEVKGAPYEFEELYYNYKGIERHIYHWIFNTSGVNEITLEYEITVDGPGVWTFSTVYFTRDETKSEDWNLVVGTGGIVPIPVECGNGICETVFGENAANCPQDCMWQRSPEYVIVVLALVTVIVFSGILYRIYKKVKLWKLKKASKKVTKKVKAKVKAVKPKIVKQIKKPKKLKKVGKTPRSYKKTLERLKKLERDLKK